MSDYTKVYDGSAKDAAHSAIQGADFDVEFSAIQSADNTKVDKESAQTVTGVKTFTATPVILDADLDIKRTTTGNMFLSFWEGANKRGTCYYRSVEEEVRIIAYDTSATAQGSIKVGQGYVDVAVGELKYGGTLLKDVSETLTNKTLASPTVTGNLSQSGANTTHTLNSTSGTTTSTFWKYGGVQKGLIRYDHSNTRMDIVKYDAGGSAWNAHILMYESGQISYSTTGGQYHAFNNTAQFVNLKCSSGATVSVFDTSGTLASNSDTRLPTQKAVKTYVDAVSSRVTTLESANLPTRVSTLESAPKVHGGQFQSGGTTDKAYGDITSCTRTATGTYKVNHTIGSGNYLAVANGITTGISIKNGSYNSTYFYVYTYNASGTLVDSGFSVIVCEA